MKDKLIKGLELTRNILAGFGFYFAVLFIFSITVAAGYFDTHLATTAKIAANLFATTDQNALHYVKENQIADPNFQKAQAAFYLKRYFSPWTNQNRYYTDSDVKITAFNTPGVMGWYGENHKKHSEKWLKKILNNLPSAQNFLNINKRGIVVHRTSLRGLPTEDPGFANPKKAGEGYPFDYLQFSELNTGDPVRIYTATKDGVWTLVGKDYYFGWVKSEDIAYVSDKFVKNWMDKKFIVPLKDDVSVYDQYHHYRISTRIGLLYPVLKKTKNQYCILTPAKDPVSGYAMAIPVCISKSAMTEFPYFLTTKHVAELINQLEDHPYGWGDLHGYRDCSSTTRDLFATFGIWLPRNSQQQVSMDSVIDLSGMSNAEKEKIIIEKGVPFMTLLHRHGHVLVYIGHDKNNIYVFQDMWGIKTSLFGMHEGRAIIGAPVITTMTFESIYHNVPRTNLDNSDRMLVLARGGKLLIEGVF